MSMKNPPHPGLSVKIDCLESRGITVTEAAKRFGVRCGSGSPRFPRRNDDPGRGTRLVGGCSPAG